jgi:hypothetical protein
LRSTPAPPWMTSSGERRCGLGKAGTTVQTAPGAGSSDMSPAGRGNGLQVVPAAGRQGAHQGRWSCRASGRHYRSVNSTRRR